MSVIYDVDSAWWVEQVQPWSCSYCGEELEPPCQGWNLATGQLLLHGRCATTFSSHLAGDARELLLASDPAPHWRRRALALTRYRLRDEEQVA